MKNALIIIFILLILGFSPYPAFALSPNDPLFNSQWNLRRINAELAWDMTGSSSDIIIAILDTGVNYNHEDLKNKMWRDSASGNYGYDFVNNDPDPMDDHKHGTMVAGITAAAVNNGLGIAGIAKNSKIMAVKVMDSTGEGKVEDIAKGIRYATDHGARVINMSFGLSSPSQILAEAIDWAWSHGVVLVAATGNKGLNQIDYPATNPKVLGVGAIDQNDFITSFSNYGPEIDVVAPARNIVSSSWMPTAQLNFYEMGSGTSFAAAHVSGLVALLLSTDPSLSPAQIIKRIRASADKLAGMNGIAFTNQYGYGRINLSNAVSFDKIGPQISAAINNEAGNFVLSGTITDDNTPSSIDPNITTSNVKSASYKIDDGNWIPLFEIVQKAPFAFNMVLQNITATNKTVTIRAIDTSDNTSISTINISASLGPATTTNSDASAYHASFISQSNYISLTPGGSATLWLELRNSGSATWDQNIVHLGTSRPQDRPSVFYTPSNWLGNNRIKMDQQSVAPGGVARFTFTITAPSTPGVYKEYFRPVADSITWMEDFGIYWQITVVNKQ